MRSWAQAPAVIAATAAAIGFALAIRLHVVLLQHPGPMGFDDGYTLALGERLIDGQWLPYVDGCSHRGPLLYWAAGLAQLVTGRYGWLGGRVLSAVTMLSSVAGVFAVGVVARAPLAGAVAALFQIWALFGVYPTGGTFCVTGEGVGSPVAVAAILATSMALLRARTDRTRRNWLVLGGALAALAGLAKQTLLPMIGPLALWTLAATWDPNLPRGVRFRRLGSLGAGFAGVFLLVIVRYAVVGELGTFWYWYYGYNAEIYMAPYRESLAIDTINAFLKDYSWAVGAFVFIVSASLGRVVSSLSPRRGILRGYAASGLEVTSALIAILCFLSGVAAQRFWPHYFQVVFPFLGLVIGLRAEALLKGQAAFRALGAVVLFVGLVALVGQTLTIRYGELAKAHRGAGANDPTAEPLCQAIARHSRPEDPLFVWGFGGDVYLTCRKRPATRFTYLTLVAGMVPPRWGVIREAWVARGSRELLLADLKRANPPVIVDMPGTMGEVGMTKIQVLRAYLEEHYCKQARLSSRGRNADIWVRKNLPACRVGGSSYPDSSATR